MYYQHCLHLPGGTIKLETQEALSIAVVPKLEWAPARHTSRAWRDRLWGPTPRRSDSGDLGWGLGNHSSNRLLGAAGPGTTFREQLVYGYAKKLNKNRIVQQSLGFFPRIPQCLPQPPPDAPIQALLFIGTSVQSNWPGEGRLVHLGRDLDPDSNSEVRFPGLP